MSFDVLNVQKTRRISDHTEVYLAFNIAPASTGEAFFVKNNRILCLQYTVSIQKADTRQIWDGSADWMNSAFFCWTHWSVKSSNIAIEHLCERVRLSIKWLQAASLVRFYRPRFFFLYFDKQKRFTCLGHLWSRCFKDIELNCFIFFPFPSSRTQFVEECKKKI